MNNEIYRSSLGDILIKADGGELVSVSLLVKDKAAPAPKPSIATSLAKTQLDDYFHGKLNSFTLPIKFSGTPFQKSVWNLLLSIPLGKSMSYGEVARAIGNPKASRAVGTAVGANPLFIIVPCHRILAANGVIGGFAYGTEIKKQLLDHEKIDYKG